MFWEPSPPSSSGNWLPVKSVCSTTQTDFAGSQFPDDKGGGGSWNDGVFTIKLFNMAGSLRTFYPV
jgi:hypothetical protein